MESIRVLVITNKEDRDFPILDKFNSSINSNKYNFTLFREGQDDLKVKLNSKIDILLIDINMLAVDRINRLVNIKKLNLLGIIVMLDYGNIDSIKQAMDMGAFDFIMKPINFISLDVTINRTLHYIKQTRELKSIKENNIRLKRKGKQYKKQENYLKAKENRLSILLQTSFEAMIIYEDNKIIKVNSRFANIFGYDVDEVVGISILDFIAPDYRLIIIEALKKTCNNRLDLVAIKKDGSPVNIRMLLKTVPYMDKGIKVISLIDITDIKKADELRKANERIIRHELKNQLGGIIGFAQLFLDEVGLKKNHLEWINCILDSANQLLYILNHSADILKMEKGIYTLRPRPFDMIKLFNKLDNVIQYTLNHRMGSTSYYINGKPISVADSYYIKGEEKHIEGLFAILLKNVFEYAPKNTKVTISIEQDRDSHKFIIQNDSILLDKFKKKFINNYKSKNSSSSKLGLGTYSAFIIAKTHGGNVSFSDSEGKLQYLTVEIPKKLPSIHP